MNLLFSPLCPLLEGERGGEYSEARLAFLWSVIEEFVAEAVSTLATGDLQGRSRLLVLRHAVWFYCLREGRPRRRVLELVGAVEKLITTFRASVDT